jgi:hypothetical protein
MGLQVPVAEAILAEHRYRKIEGNVLFVGRQTTFLDEKSLGRLLGKHGLALPEEFTFEFDTETRGADGQRFITDRCFMRSLGVDNVNFLDVTDYEGADIVHDLGYPIPDSLRDRYDFIYDGGCFDNMFNPGVAIVNLSKMLRPGGRVICFESVSSWNSPYLMYSPGWFWDYYVVNGFFDCKIYIGSFRDADELALGPWGWFYVNIAGAKNDWQERNGRPPAARENNHLVLVSIAEKGPHSTSDRQPIQLQYRVNKDLIDECEKNAHAMRACPRPVILGSDGTQHYDRYVTPLGRIGDGIHPRSAGLRCEKFIRRNLRALKIIVRMLLNRVVV